MGRLCTVCTHPECLDIDEALLEHATGYRDIGRRFGVEWHSLIRHEHNHLRSSLRQSQEVQSMASVEHLTARMAELEAYVTGVLERNAEDGDDRVVLLAVREGRGNVEVLAKLGPLGAVEQRLAAVEQAIGQPPDPPIAEETADDGDPGDFEGA